MPVMEICGKASQIDLAFQLAREMGDEHRCRCGYVDFIDGSMRAAECVRAECNNRKDNNFGFHRELRAWHGPSFHRSQRLGHIKPRGAVTQHLEPTWHGPERCFTEIIILSAIAGRHQCYLRLSPVGAWLLWRCGRPLVGLWRFLVAAFSHRIFCLSFTV